MDKMYRVFISSTFEDLKEERKEVIQVLLDIDCIPTGMELFQASDDDQWSLIEKVISACDYYIVIVAGRYGSIHPKTGKSYTQMEYEYALKAGIPIMGFIYKDFELLPWNKVDNISKLNDFIRLVQKKTVRYWKTPEELARNVATSLHRIVLTHPRPGWVKCDVNKIETCNKQTATNPLSTTTEYPIGYWYSGLMELANILFGGGITGIATFFSENMKAHLPKIAVTEIENLNVQIPTNNYILSYMITNPFCGLIVLCVEQDFWDRYIKHYFLNAENAYQSFEKIQDFADSGLHELCSIFSCRFVTDLSYMIRCRVDIRKCNFSEQILSHNEDMFRMFSDSNKLFVASQSFCSDCAKFKAYFFCGPSAIEQALNNVK